MHCASWVCDFVTWLVSDFVRDGRPDGSDRAAAQATQPAQRLLQAHCLQRRVGRPGPELFSGLANPASTSSPWNTPVLWLCCWLVVFQFLLREHAVRTTEGLQLNLESRVVNQFAPVLKKYFSHGNDDVQLVEIPRRKIIQDLDQLIPQFGGMYITLHTICLLLTKWLVNVASERSERSEFVVRRVPSKTSSCDSVRTCVSFTTDLRSHSTDFYDFFSIGNSNSDSKKIIFQKKICSWE